MLGACLSWETWVSGEKNSHSLPSVVHTVAGYVSSHRLLLLNMLADEIRSKLGECNT